MGFYTISKLVLIQSARSIISMSCGDIWVLQTVTSYVYNSYWSNSLVWRQAKIHSKEKLLSSKLTKGKLKGHVVCIHRTQKAPRSYPWICLGLDHTHTRRNLGESRLFFSKWLTNLKESHGETTQREVNKIHWIYDAWVSRVPDDQRKRLVVAWFNKVRNKHQTQMIIKHVCIWTNIYI